MILSDNEILTEIEAGNIIIEPPVRDEDISPSSVDVHLSDQIFRFKKQPNGVITHIDLSHPNIAASLIRLLEPVPLSAQGYTLQPREFVIAYTIEKVTLPPTIAARLEGRSTNARFGITIHSTAPTIHPTYSGYLTLELCNMGVLPCDLCPGFPIGQLIFERVGSVPVRTLKSHWQGQVPPKLDK